MDEGQLDINQYVGKDILYKLTTLAPHKEEWSIKEFQNALQVDIDYDLVALAMAYLKIWSAD